MTRPVEPRFPRSLLRVVGSAVVGSVTGVPGLFALMEASAQTRASQSGQSPTKKLAAPATKPISHSSGAMKGGIQHKSVTAKPHQTPWPVKQGFFTGQIAVLLVAAYAVIAVERLHWKRHGRAEQSASGKELLRRPPAERRNRGRRGFAYRGSWAKIWPLMLAGIRWVLLISIFLPPVALWWGEWHTLPSHTTLISAGVLAAVALLASRLARGQVVIALTVCSGVSTVLLLAHALLASGAYAPVSWLKILTILPGAKGHVAQADALQAGYLIGSIIVFSTTLAIGTGPVRRTLFETPPLEHRAVSPLQAPLPAESRAQLRVLFLNGLIAIGLAARPFGVSALFTFVTALATGVQLWGWRNKQLGIKQLAVAACGAAGATLIFWLLFSPASGIDALHHAVSGAIGTVEQAGRAFDASLQTLVKGGIVARLPVMGLCLAVLLGACGTLHRPPMHLWAILGRSPVWGWMLLGGITGAFFAACCAGGTAIALALLVTVLAGFFFIWLEGAEVL